MKRNKFLISFLPFLLLVVLFCTLLYFPNKVHATVNQPCCKGKWNYDASRDVCIWNFMGVNTQIILCNVPRGWPTELVGELEKCQPVNLEKPEEDKGICVYANSNLTPTPTPLPPVPPADESKCTTVPYQIDASYTGPISIYGNGIKKGTVYWVIINQGTPNKFAANEDGKLTFTWLRGWSDTPGSAGAETIVIKECGSDIDLCLGRKSICTAGFFVVDEALPWQTIPPLAFCDDSNPPKPIADSGVTGKVYTALGCIPLNNFNDFIGWLLSKLIFVASGIAFLLMVLGAIQILTSAGNPDKVKAGKELITSALSGLLFIILSIFLLKLIGVDILHIPGLGK